MPTRELAMQVTGLAHALRPKAIELRIAVGNTTTSVHGGARAAEDELSFYGSVDTRDHWSSSRRPVLAMGRLEIG